MKYIYAAVLFQLLISSCFAMDLPEVKCELNYSERNPDGSSKTMKRGEVVVVTTSPTIGENNGFELGAKIERSCAADGGPCHGYSLRRQFPRRFRQAISSIQLFRHSGAELARRFLSAMKMVFSIAI